MNTDRAIVRRTLWGAALLCVAAVAAISTLAAGQAPPAGQVLPAGQALPPAVRVPPPPLRVGVVDMARVLKESAQWRDAVERRARAVDAMRRTVDKLTRQVQILRTEMDNLPPETEERARKAVELEQAINDLQRTQGDMEGQMAGEYSESIRAFYASLSEASSAYAREAGLGLVLKKQDIPLTGPDSVEQSLQISTAEVLYADPSLDVSAPVIQRMNAAYAGPIEVK